MKEEYPKINQMGERGILIEFEPEISESVLQRVLSAKENLKKAALESNVEVINTYNSLLISYVGTIEDSYGEVLKVRQVLTEADVSHNIKPQLFSVPVCYDKEFGLDLEHIASEKNLSIDEIIRLHTEPIYTVFFIGFLPGFLYLGGLDEKLQISRRKEPRMKVSAGAVGIGESQTGIYPKMSPGGWQLIGNSPVPLFVKEKVPPCEISAGDKIKFYSVSKKEFLEIKDEVAEGVFHFKTEEYAG